MTNSMFSIHLGRLAGAAVTVLLTTLEDAIWLVPLILKASTKTIGVLHAATFIATFTLLSLSIGLVTKLALKQTQVENLKRQDFVLAAAGALLCWIVAAVLYYRAWRKRQKRQREKEEWARQSDLESAALFEPVDSSRTITSSGPALSLAPGYGSVDAPSEALLENGGSEESSQPESQQQIWLVISLTVIGALDEVSYFPALIVGDVFSVAELTLGTALASVVILLIVCFALAPCRPALEFLDEIPLYGVVFVFAIILSSDALWQWYSG